MRTLTLQESARLTARIKDDEDLRAALADLRGCASNLAAQLRVTDAGALAFVALQARRGDSLSVDELCDAREVRHQARLFLDWAEQIERANTATRDRCAQGDKALELELLGAATRQREIVGEIERIETALGECESESERKRRSMEAVGVPAALAATLAPDRDRTALAARRADLQDEDRALGRFVASYDLKKLPKEFGPWFEAWKTRCGVRPAEAEAA
jgi:hypothetical protein